MGSGWCWSAHGQGLCWCGGIGRWGKRDSAANLCARLSSQAAAGEILISEESIEYAGMQDEGLERRVLELKGISEKIPVQVIQA